MDIANTLEDVERGDGYCTVSSGGKWTARGFFYATFTSPLEKR
jgi:hypothetical protein